MASPNKNRKVETSDYGTVTVTPDGRVFSSQGNELDVDASINALRGGGTALKINIGGTYNNLEGFPAGSQLNAGTGYTATLGGSSPTKTPNGISFDPSTGKVIRSSTNPGLDMFLNVGSSGASKPADRKSVADRFRNIGTSNSLPKRPTVGAIEVPDAGDAMDGGGSLPDGAGPSDTDTRVSKTGLYQTGRNLGPKPINIPDIKVNPFEAAGLKRPNPAEVEIGGKTYEVDEEARVDMDDVTENMSVKQEFNEKPAEKREKYAPESFNGDFGNDYGDYEDYEGPSAMDIARKAAITDTPYGAGPMEILRRRNAAMGTAYEKDDIGRMTGRTLFNNDGNVEVMGEGQDKQYYNDPQSFLKDVMSGSVKIGGDKAAGEGSESGEAPSLRGMESLIQTRKGYPEMYLEEGVPFDQDSGVNVNSPAYPAQDVDFTDMTSVIPFDGAGYSMETAGTPAVSAEPLGGAMTHAQIDALPKIKGPNGELVPDLSKFYK